MANKTQIMPHFVEVRGCINCDASKEYKKRTGKDYGFDHELMAGCLLGGCQDFGVTLLTPIIDPEEVLRIFKFKKITKQQNKNVVNYLRRIDCLVGKYYIKIGVDIKKIIAEVEKY